MRDIEIRQLLRSTQLSKYFADSESKVVEELKLPVAQARIDIAVINGHLHGFEIKSAVDTLQRLPGQITAYTKIFDYLSIVTEGKYYQKILDSTPDWISVYTCTEKAGKCKIVQVRSGSKNKNKEGFFIAKLLWREELIEVLTEQKISFKQKERNWLLCEALANNMTVPELSKIVRTKLKQRIDWKLDL
ncbi:MAG TPA: sce7726 family protein [Chitinophagaceae bacterium]|nr:sce7726 family protein [Chitinophagaceae bacterium]